MYLIIDLRTDLGTCTYFRTDQGTCTYLIIDLITDLEEEDEEEEEGTF